MFSLTNHILYTILSLDHQVITTYREQGMSGKTAKEERGAKREEGKGGIGKQRRHENAKKRQGVIEGVGKIGFCRWCLIIAALVILASFVWKGVNMAGTMYLWQ